MTATEITPKIAPFVGRNYRDAEYVAVADSLEWNGCWPEITPDGKLTGFVLDSDDADHGDYANVADLAVVDIAALPNAERARITDDRERGFWDGYARLTA
jgi:hypothetical protein